MRRQLVMPICSGILIAIACSYFALPRLAKSQEAPANKATIELKDIDAIKLLAVSFEKAYNAANAREIASQFTENAEVVDEDGDVIEGRARIEARFAELFQEYPKAHIAIEVTSVRQLGPDLAMEYGLSMTTLTPDKPVSRSPYTLVHVKRDGKWQVASLRDFPEEAPDTTASDQLQSLKWLVGHWVDESSDGRVETKCQWSADGNYLLQDYNVRTRRGEMHGTQRIAWDPLRHVIRSWAFDDSGAFTEATWTSVENAWILKVEGVTPDGRGASATRTVTPINDDSYQIDSTNVVVGNELLPDTSVRVVRQPPTPSLQP
ncbi:MAG: SgcJ/EcaC family oxidoreductase [Planctomycetes bacterium]|nr:SgcJ/EcaC family oxidoreductase [Planctomycetota bacterium]